MKKKRRIRRNYSRLIDLIILLVFLCTGIYALYRTFVLSILPTHWFFLITFAFLLLFLIFFVLLCMKLSKGIVIVKRMVLLLLCGCACYVGYSMKNVSAAVEKITLQQTSPTIDVHILVRKDSTIETIEELANTTMGIQVGTDLETTQYALTQLEKETAILPTYEETLDYSALSNLFMNQMVDAMMVSSDYLPMLEANVEGFQDAYRIVTTYQKERPQNPSDTKDISQESFTLLISGVDEVGTADRSTNSDVNILLFVNPSSNQITMLSLPRDSMMPNAALQNTNDKLTHTGAYGVENTVETIENFFAIDIDYFAKVSFSSLIEIVDCVGGVDVDVEIPFTEQDENRSFAEDDLIHLEAGMQHLNGKEALAYARHRKTDGYGVAGRERAQEKIIKAIIDKLLTPEGLVYINPLLDTVPRYVVTNMPGKQITSFLQGELNDLKPWTIQSLTAENGSYDRRNVPNLALPQDVYLWNIYDYRMVLDAYETSKKNLPFSDFAFDLDAPLRLLPEIQENPNIIWDTMLINPRL